MEEKRLDRRSFLKYAGVGSLATLSLIAGGTKVAKGQVAMVLGFLGKIPEDVLLRLPKILAAIDKQPDRYLVRFMTEPRELLRDEFDMILEPTKYQVIAFDLDPTPVTYGDGEELPKLYADPSYPYPAELKLEPVCIGFIQGRAALILRDRGG